jgi:alpha-D-xyloside xylohydrolase
MDQIYPGIYKLTFGQPEGITPVMVRSIAPAHDRLAILPEASCPIDSADIEGWKSRRGYHLRLPLRQEEQVFGLGLQLLSFNQRRHKKTLRVNSDPIADLGDTHAPVPFYVTTGGYGVLVDTARYATFTIAAAQPVWSDPPKPVPGEDPAASLQALIDHVSRDRGGPVLVDIPAADGVTIYLFAGPTMLEAVQRYNLFSGGGCLPPRWGLGVWYRGKSSFDQVEMASLAASLRSDRMPCDVLGLEPGWQSHAYSCSFTWSEKFPDPEGMIKRLAVQGFRVNPWTHAFVHPSAPFYLTVRPYSGDYQVWDGLVPDFLTEGARRIFTEYFGREHVDLGISGYKLDECDNSDFNGVQWSFPESSTFPSGADGEQMHSLFGLLFQEMILSLYRQRGQRTYGLARSSHALAAAYPFVVYSDLYGHREFIRGVVNSGFSGLLWTPEVRDARSEEDLIRRLQSVVLSPLALINAWYIANPPWKQWRMAENNAGQFLADWQTLEDACREVLELRMRLVPYLYAAFYQYCLDGTPPWRALALDHPHDAETWRIDDQFYIGDRLVAAPVIAGQSRRKVYLPKGVWYDFWSGAPVAGGQWFTVEVSLPHIPLFVKGGCVLPVAVPTLHTEDKMSFRLEARIYGDGAEACTLYEDDGKTLAYQQGEYNSATLAWSGEHQRGEIKRVGKPAGEPYQVTAWKVMNPK